VEGSFLYVNFEALVTVVFKFCFKILPATTFKKPPVRNNTVDEKESRRRTYGWGAAVRLKWRHFITV